VGRLVRAPEHDYWRQLIAAAQRTAMPAPASDADPVTS
jgi:hypothetical protein